MTDLATLQAQLDAIKTARASGAATINYEGKSVTYRSDAEMQAAIASLQQEIAAAGGGSMPTVAVVRSSKGY